MLVYEGRDQDPDLARKITKVTQRLISALSAYTEEGGLYEVDMALRPSGRSGPVAVSLDAFSSYYKDSAWTWEFMALSRARVICATSTQFQSRLEKALAASYSQPRQDLDMPSDIADMLERVRREKPPRHNWDLKNQIGGLRDIEFIAQSLILKCRLNDKTAKKTATLAMLEQAHSLNLLSAKSCQELIRALSFYDQFRHAQALTLGNQADVTQDQDRSFILDLMDLSPKSFDKAYQAHRRAVEKLVQTIILSTN